jgi:hypothetical protein
MRIPKDCRAKCYTDNVIYLDVLHDDCIGAMDVHVENWEASQGIIELSGELWIVAKLWWPPFHGHIWHTVVRLPAKMSIYEAIGV